MSDAHFSTLLDAVAYDQAKFRRAPKRTAVTENAIACDYGQVTLLYSEMTISALELFGVPRHLCYPFWNSVPTKIIRQGFPDPSPKLPNFDVYAKNSWKNSNAMVVVLNLQHPLNQSNQRVLDSSGADYSYKERTELERRQKVEILKSVTSNFGSAWGAQVAISRGGNLSDIHKMSKMYGAGWNFISGAIGARAAPVHNLSSSNVSQVARINLPPSKHKIAIQKMPWVR